METHTLEALWCFLIGAACGVTLEAFTVTRKWKEISRKWREQSTRSTAIGAKALEAFRAASNLALDQAEAIDAIFQTWENYRDEAATAPTPEGPVETLARINNADRSIRTVIATLHTRTAQRHEDAKEIARSLPLPQGAQESGTVRAEERSEEGQR